MQQKIDSLVDGFVITRKLFTRQAISGNGIGTILATMMAYLQFSSLNENFDKIQQSSTDRPYQLVLASNISLFAGSLVESVGFSYALFQKGSFRPDFQANPAIRLGGMIGAFASILDEIGAVLKVMNKKLFKRSFLYGHKCS